MIEFVRNRIGPNGVAVTELGLGCAGLAGLFSSVTEEEASDTVAQALAQGIGYFDTAPLYGHGLSEFRLGHALQGESCVVSTKVGRLLRPGPSPEPGPWAHPLPQTPYFDYSYDGVMRGVTDSLKRMGRERIEILYMHDLGNLVHGDRDGPAHMRKAMEGGYRALDELRRSGQVGAIGLAVSETRACREALIFGEWDVFQISGCYNLLDQRALDELFPICKRVGTAVVVGAPFATGALAGGAQYNYGPVPERVAARIRTLCEICERHGVDLPAAALAFCRAHPVVKSVLPGPRSVGELSQLLDWWVQPIPQAFWDELTQRGLLREGAPTPALTEAA